MCCRNPSIFHLWNFTQLILQSKISLAWGFGRLGRVARVSLVNGNRRAWAMVVVEKSIIVSPTLAILFFEWQVCTKCVTFSSYTTLFTSRTQSKKSQISAFSKLLLFLAIRCWSCWFIPRRVTTWMGITGAIFRLDYCLSQRFPKIKTTR